MQLLCYVHYKPPDPNMAIIISTRCLIYSDIYSELKALAKTLHYYSVTEVRDGSTHDLYFHHGFYATCCRCGLFLRCGYYTH